MKIALFLIQTAGGLPEHFAYLRQHDYVLLSFKENTPDTTIYAPETTWTTGRNKLYEYVRENQLDDYHYYVFLDDDISFSHRATSSIEERKMKVFLSALQVLIPYSYAIVVPYCHNHGSYFLEAERDEGLCFEGGRNMCKGLDCFTAFRTIPCFDGMFCAFSHEAFFSGLLLPYNAQHDSISWYISNYLLLLKANHFYRNRILEVSFLPMGNLLSRKGYPTFSYSKTSFYKSVLKELGVDSIKVSDYAKVEIPLPLRIKLWVWRSWLVKMSPSFRKAKRSYIQKVLKIPE